MVYVYYKKKEVGYIRQRANISEYHIGESIAYIGKCAEVTGIMGYDRTTITFHLR